MSPRSLVLVPVVGVAVCVLVERLLVGTPAHAIWLRSQIELAKGLSLTGALVAALAFDPGDYLRRAWLWTGACMAVLLVRDATLVPVFESLGFDIEVLRGGLVVVANVCAVIGTWMLARAWKVAGIELPGGRLGVVGVVAGAALLALLLAGPGIVVGARQLAEGDFEGTVSLASGLGDLISLCLIAPVLLTALALRGGQLVWPWGLLTASMVAWLGYDAALVGLPLLGLSAEAVLPVSEAFRCLACLFGLVAGIAQRWVVHGLSRVQEA